MMKIVICLTLALSYCSINSYPYKIIETAYAQQKPIPPYAKWGVLALKKTKEKYPNAKVIDYLHIGRVAGPNTSTEKFKLWLKDNQKEFGVFVDIEFANKTEDVVNITFKETPK